MGLVLTASANLITKVPLMFQFLPTIELKVSGVFYVINKIFIYFK